jgi:hypothetical protein
MSPHLSLPLLCVAAGVLAFVRGAGAVEPADAAGFNRDIRPILSDACFYCHGPDEKHREADLRLDTSEGARMDLGGYAAVVPGHPERSALLERIASHDKEEVMPPPQSKKARLSEDARALLAKWIARAHSTKATARFCL